MAIFDFDRYKQRVIDMLPPGVDAEQFIADALKEAEQIWTNASPEQKEDIDLAWRGEMARELSLDGWIHFYWCMTRREYPEAHNKLAETLIDGVKTKRAKMIQAWRGFGKSTDLVLFVAWMIGVRPIGSTGIVRINDTKAQLTGDLIAKMIETHKGWKACFPNVLPDKGAGWSSEKGYNVIDTNVTGLPDSPGYVEGYAKWLQMCLADHPTESSLMAAGIESGNIIGWHPTNGMYFDDLHDEQNTRSQVEMQRVVDILENNIVPTWFTPKGRPILACVCTPWDSERDAYHSMLMTGLFDLVKIPIMEDDSQGVLFEPLNKRVRLAWADVETFNLEGCIAIYNASREKFFRMYLLDDTAAKELSYVYRTFPAVDIKYLEWVLTIGVDPTASVTGISKGKGKSHYAFACVYETPYSSLVIGGGYCKKVSSDVGETALSNMARLYPNLKAVSIESNSVGAAGSAKRALDAVTAGFVARNKGLVTHFHNVNELGGGSKLNRQFKFLEALFANGILLVADGNTGSAEGDEFVRLVKSALERYPNFAEDEPEADVMDALAMAVLDIPRVWTRVHTNVNNGIIALRNKEQVENPIRALGSYTYFN